MQLLQHARERRQGNVEQAGVREHAVEARRGQVEREEVLLPDLAAGVGAGHRDERRRAVEADGDVAERAKRRQVAPRPAAEVEDRER